MATLTQSPHREEIVVPADVDLRTALPSLDSVATSSANVVSERDLTSPYFLSENVMVKHSPQLEKGLKCESQTEAESMAIENIPAAAPEPLAEPTFEAAEKGKQKEIEKEETVTYVATDAAVAEPTTRIRKQRSFWDLFRRSASEPQDTPNDSTHIEFDSVEEHEACRGSTETSEQQENPKASTAVCLPQEATEHDHLGYSLLRQQSADAEKRVERKTVRRQNSLMNFSLGMPWSKSARRNTIASPSSLIKEPQQFQVHQGHVEDESLVGTLANGYVGGEHHLASRAVGAKARMPSRSATMDVQAALHKSSKQLADDHLRFAHARHLIKVTQDEHTLRSLAVDLEAAFRQQLDKVSFLHAQYEALSWQLADLQDENRHLRKQLGTLSEQIVDRQNQLDILHSSRMAKSSSPSPSSPASVLHARQSTEVATMTFSTPPTSVDEEADKAKSVDASV